MTTRFFRRFVSTALSILLILSQYIGISPAFAIEAVQIQFQLPTNRVSELNQVSSTIVQTGQGGSGNYSLGLNPGQYTLDVQQVPNGLEVDGGNPFVFSVVSGATNQFTVNLIETNPSQNQQNAVLNIDYQVPVGSNAQEADFSGLIVETNQSFNGDTQLSLVPGTYTLNTTVVPAGLMLNGASSQSISLQAGQTQTVVIDSSLMPVSSNQPGLLSISYTLPNSAQNELNNIAVRVVETGQSGQGNFSTSLNPGTYTLENIALPTGLDLQTVFPLSFAIQAGQTTNVDFNVLDTRQANVNGIIDVSFQVPSGSENLIPQFSTLINQTSQTAAGNFNTSVASGSYTIEVTQVPAGLVLSGPNTQTVTVNPGQRTNVQFQSTTAAVNPNSLQSITINYQLPNGLAQRANEITATIVETQQSGSGEFITSVLPGTYTLQFTLPADLSLNGNNPQSITVSAGGNNTFSIPVIETSQANQPAPGIGTLDVEFLTPAGFAPLADEFKTRIVETGQNFEGPFNIALNSGDYTLEFTEIPTSLMLSTSSNRQTVRVLANNTTDIDVQSQVATILRPDGPGVVQIRYDVPQGISFSMDDFVAEIVETNQTAAGEFRTSLASNNRYTVRIIDTPNGLSVVSNEQIIDVTPNSQQELRFAVQPSSIVPAANTGVLRVEYNLPPNLQDRIHEITVRIQETAQSGNGMFQTGLPVGQYTLSVDTPSDMIVLNNNPRTVNIQSGLVQVETFDLTFNPQQLNQQPGIIDVNYSVPAGSESIISNLSVRVVETGQGGAGAFRTALGAGTYTLEFTAPQGYRVANGNTQTIQINGGQTTNLQVDILLEQQNSNNPGVLTVRYQVPSGFENTINQFASNVIQTGQGGAGEYQTGVTAGDYILNVNQVPAGLRLRDGENIPFSIKANEQTTVLIVAVIDTNNNTNNNQDGVVRVLFELPTGSENRIHELSGQIVETAQTFSGRFQTGIRPGIYTLSLDQAPAGLRYSSTNPTIFSIESGNTTDVVIVLESLPVPLPAPNTGNVVVQYRYPNVISIDTVDSQLLQGNTVIQENNGNTVYRNITAGNYTITIDESTVPSGYQVDRSDNSYPVSVVAGQTSVVTVIIKPEQNARGSLSVSFQAPVGVNVNLIESILSQTGGFRENQLGNTVFTSLNTGDYQLSINPNSLPNGFEIEGGLLERSVQISADQTTMITIRLVPVSVVSGNLSVQFTAPNGTDTNTVQFTVTGPNNFQTQQNGSSTITALSPGDYTVNIVASSIPLGLRVSNDQLSQVATINAGNTTLINFTLEPIVLNGGGSVQVVFTAPNGINASGVSHQLIRLSNGPVLNGQGDFTYSNLSAGNYILLVDRQTLPSGITLTGNTNEFPATVLNNQNTVVGVSLQNIISPPNNQAPRILFGTTNANSFTANIGQQFDLNIQALDDNADDILILTLKSNASPNQASFSPPAPGKSPITGLLSFSPTATDRGLQIFTFSVIDSRGESTTRSLEITVEDNGGNGGGGGNEDTNRRGGRGPQDRGEPLVLNINSNINNNDLTVGEELELILNAQADSTDLIDFSLSKNTTELSDTPLVLDSEEKLSSPATASIKWTPDDNHVGVVELTITAKTQDNEEVSQDIVFTVIPRQSENKAPENTSTNAVFSPNRGGGSQGSKNQIGLNDDTGIIQLNIKSNKNSKNCKFSDNTKLSVEALCKLGIIDEAQLAKGFRFNGEEAITRAAFTKMMIGLVRSENSVSKAQNKLQKENTFVFPDVEPDAWFSGYIDVAKDFSVVHGYRDGDFIPWNTIEKSEAAKIAVRTASGDNHGIKTEVETIIAEDSEPWFIPYTRYLEFIGGFTAQDIDPGITYSQSLTRSEAADMIFELIMAAEEESGSSLYKLQVQYKQ